MPCRLGLSGNQKSSGHHSQKSAMNYRCSMVPKISYQFLGVQKKCCAIPIEMGFSWISSWIFMDFYMLVSQLFPKKNDGSFHVFRKSPSGWAAIFCISSSETADGNGWVEHVRETPPKSHGSEKNIHFSAYFHIYIYMCPSK